MEVKTFTFIVLAELCILSLLVVFGLIFYIQKLKQQLKKALAAQAKPAAQAPAPDEPPDPVDELVQQRDVMPDNLKQKTYTAYIDDELMEARRHHEELGGGRDIALDIDPSAPLERRIAAVRHAVLIAEREATLTDEVNWVSLKGRYKALLSYYEDFPSPKAEARIHELSEALRSAQKHVASIEKYKGLYFDLEASWHASKNQADEYYEQIKGRVDKNDEGADGLIELVGEYHRSYDSVNVIFDSQMPLPETIEAASEELRALRRTTAEQHRLIDDLKKQIDNATDDNAKVALIRNLEDELNRQQRFLRESESCVKLMEDELSVTHKELQSLKAKLKELPSLRAHLKDLQEESGVSDVMINRLKDEVRTLKLELSSNAESYAVEAVSAVAASPAASAEQDPALAKELSALKKQYAELEERYLDLKLQG